MRRRTHAHIDAAGRAAQPLPPAGGDVVSIPPRSAVSASGPVPSPRKSRKAAAQPVGKLFRNLRPLLQVVLEPTSPITWCSVPVASSRACRGILALALRLESRGTPSELFLSVNNVPHYEGVTDGRKVPDAIVGEGGRIPKGIRRADRLPERVVGHPGLEALPLRLQVLLRVGDRDQIALSVIFKRGEVSQGVGDAVDVAPPIEPAPENRTGV